MKLRERQAPGKHTKLSTVQKSNKRKLENDSDGEGSLQQTTPQSIFTSLKRFISGSGISDQHVRF